MTNSEFFQGGNNYTGGILREREARTVGQNKLSLAMNFFKENNPCQHLGFLWVLSVQSCLRLLWIEPRLSFDP